jgi:hypothetical protein
MRKLSLLMLAFFAFGAAGYQTAPAQFPGKIKIPKPSKPKAEEPPSDEPVPTNNTQPAKPQPESGDATNPAAATTGDDQPTIAKDSIQVRAYTNDVYKGNYDTWSWVPRLEYRVNGPITSGSQLYAEFSAPNGPWIKFDCKTGEAQKGHWWKTECGGNDLPREQGITYTGTVNFTIRLRNELAGTDATLFTGKMKVGKAHSNLTGPTAVNKWVYYVNGDWNLPIGYVFYEPHDVKGWKLPTLNFAFWARGEESDPFQPHLFHDGKEVGKKYYQGEEVGKPSCGMMEVQNNPSHFTTSDEPKFIWTRWKCYFPNVKGWDKTGDRPGMFGPPYVLGANAGDYEIKILFKGHLVRSIKFAVDAEGKIVDNGIAAANKLGSNRIIEPVQVLGDSDGPWDRNAWKTDAFYGNPLTGFSGP